MFQHIPFWGDMLCRYTSIWGSSKFTDCISGTLPYGDSPSEELQPSLYWWAELCSSGRIWLQHCKSCLAAQIGMLAFWHFTWPDLISHNNDLWLVWYLRYISLGILTEQKRMEKLALTTCFCLFAIIFLLLLPPAHLNCNSGSHTRSKVSAGHTKSIVRFNPVLRRAAQYTNKS